MKKIKAIVIKSNDRKEKDKNILLFSIEEGKIWATLKGVKGANAKMKLAQSPFCFAEFIVEEGKAGWIVTGLEIIETFHEISEDVDKFFEASAVLEVANLFDFSTSSERAVFFVLLIKTLKTICFSKAKNLYCLDKFFLEIFRASGFPLDPEKCSCCGIKAFDKLYMNYDLGALECGSCKNFATEEVSNAVLSAIKILNNTDFDRLATVRLASESELGALKLLVRNFELRFDKKINLIGILR